MNAMPRNEREKRSMASQWAGHLPSHFDVDRLARALAIAEVGCYGFAGFHDGIDAEQFHKRQAEAVATAYAKDAR